MRRDDVRSHRLPGQALQEPGNLFAVFDTRYVGKVTLGRGLEGQLKKAAELSTLRSANSCPARLAASSKDVL
jgi:hypothetical protein